MNGWLGNEYGGKGGELGRVMPEAERRERRPDSKPDGPTEKRKEGS